MTNPVHSIPAAIRALLACPKCRGVLVDGVLGEKGAQPAAEELVCGKCGLAYPVEEGIPVLLIDRATPYLRVV